MRKIKSFVNGFDNDICAIKEQVNWQTEKQSFSTLNNENKID